MMRGRSVAQQRVLMLAHVVSTYAIALSVARTLHMTLPPLRELGHAISALYKEPTVVLRVPRTLEEVEPPEPLGTDWDPEETEDVIVTPEMLDGSQVRALMLEVLRRAIHDWVLYRTSRRMEHRELAQHAYTWLFEEKEGHPWRTMRRQHGLDMMSLEAICETIDIDIETVRTGARNMTERRIKTAGRPPERRRRVGEDHSHYAEHDLSINFTYPVEEDA